MSAIIGWNSMTDEQQFSMIERGIYAAARKRGARIEDAAEYVGDVWMRVTEALQGEPDIDKLLWIVFRAADASIRREQRYEQKADACIRETQNRDGESVSVVETLIASWRDSTEQQAIIRVTLEQFLDSKDSVDLEIINGLAAGFSAREIAEEAGMSHTAVNKRVSKLRTVLRESVA